MIEVSGGGAPLTRVSRPVTVGGAGAAPVFGPEPGSFSMVPEEEGGGVDARAGSHPFQLTTSFALNQTGNPLVPPGLTKDLRFSVPAGLVANVVTFPHCSELDFMTRDNAKKFGDECPENTAVGVVLVNIDEPVFGGVQTYPIPVFNLTPKKGEPARFGFFFIGIPVTIDFSLRTGSDYGAIATVSNITQIANVLSETLTIWGVPGDPAHNAARGWDCLAEGFYGSESRPCVIPAPETHPTPFLTLPTSCSTPFSTSVEGDAWPTKAAPLGLRFPAAGQPVPSYSLQDDFGRTLGLTGCDELPFDPSFSFAPGVPQASTATGFRMDLRVPQEVSENAGGRVTSAVKDVNIVFPEGVVVNPADANGLAACSEGLVGFTGFGELNPAGEHGTQTALFTPRLPGSVPALEAGETEPLRPGVNFCSTAAKIANVKIVSPLVLKDPLEGAVYLAAQNENPFGSLIAAYLVAEDEQAGVLVKAAGEVQLSASGQISTTFKNNPAVPFEDLEVNFLDGERAALATPARCETYTTTATLTPWSGNPPATIHSKFKLTSGPGGGPCPGPGATLPLTPSFTAGTTSINAGGFTPLTTTIARPDGNQQLQSVQVTMPPGVSGILTGVPLCPEAAANEGACPAGSLIGETTITAGVGGQPVTIKGGKVYLTERYAGAPFGLAIVNPVKAGPFDLEHDTNNPAQHPACDCLVIRAKVQIDPTTAQLTVTTDPSGPHAIPSVIDGVPAQIKTANVTITRPAFTINPTDCNPMSIQTTITGAEGTTTPTITTPFQIANCANLKFEPKIHVFTGAHPTKANGTNLIFKISYPKNPLGQQAWFQSAKFNIPKQLPARLTTIQKACPAQTFETNPAACPAGSRIGQATVHTPALPVPLNGPVYFVSHGGAKFPDVVMVLQGYGITIQLRGETLIRKGVTSAIFRNTPDVPFQSIEVNIPQGPHSEFTANLPPKAKNNMCGQKLTIPTLIKAQNNQQLKQNTPITITNCNKPNTKPKKK